MQQQSYFDLAVSKPKTKDLWTGNPVTNNTDLSASSNPLWVSYSDISPEKVDVIEVDVTNVIGIPESEENVDEIFGNLLTNSKFINEVRETDRLFKADPSKFTNLSELYRKIKKSR